MSNLSRFMSTARAVLDERDRKAANPDQPAFFVRTSWLFAELEELALSSETETFAAIKVARLGGDIAHCGRLIAQIRTSSETLPGQQHYERRQLCDWIKDQIKREGVI